MPVNPLPANPNLEHLKGQAKDLLKAHKGRDLGVLQRIREFHPRFRNSTDAAIAQAKLTLSDAQLAIARERGFASWPRLKAFVEKPDRPNLNLPHHERIEDPVFRRAVDLLDAGDAGGLRALLATNPALVRQRVVFEGGNYFTNPALLEFIAENPTRRGTMPPNILEIAKIILDAGGREDQGSLNDTLGLVASSRVARERGAQAPLIRLLVEYGADPDSALMAALMHGEFPAVEALLVNGARRSLPVAAALGSAEDAARLLPASTAEERHLSLALAAQHGRLPVVRLLLDAGEDPNRYNPVGGHSHTTPLHQAAHDGHLDVVREFVERGARLDMPDLMHHGTPLGWAVYLGQKEVEEYLRDQEAKR